MQITVKGKQIDVGDALRAHIDEKLDGAVSKYFANPLEAQVVLVKDAHLYKADISVHVSRNILVQGQGSATDPYAAADMAIEHVAKRVRRYKRRLKDHHKNAGESQQAAAYVLAPEPEEEAENGAGQPVVIAEMTTEIATLAVSDAVMRMDLSDAPALLFRHAGHGGLNLVYRRQDGNIGWIDPQGNAPTGKQSS